MPDMDSADLAPLGRVGMIGAGAVARALSRALAARGAHVSAIAAPHPESARALVAALPAAAGARAVAAPADVLAITDLVILAVPDDALAALVASLPWRPGYSAVHLSGAKSAAVLAPAAARGARTAALHPLMTFPRQPLDAPVAVILERLAGCVWALDCDDPALAASLTALVAALDGQVVRLSAADRVPYHLSGVLASNYVVALIGAAVRLWTDSLGVAPDEALRALLPLLRASVESLATHGLPDALTGPLARGDSGTVAAHLAWLDAHAAGDPQVDALRDAYRALGRLALPLASAKGTLPLAAADALRALLDAPPRQDGP
ncbi:MAG: DUF2520 domain-containing protein [Ktedonobacterales bacterium]